MEHRTRVRPIRPKGTRRYRVTADPLSEASRRMPRFISVRPLADLPAHAGPFTWRGYVFTLSAEDRRAGRVLGDPYDRLRLRYSAR